MSFLLDTDICSSYLRDQRRLFTRFIQHSGRLYTSRIVIAELSTWAHGSPKSQVIRDAMEALFQITGNVRIIELDEAVSDRFGLVRAGLLKQGLIVGPMDLLIAATALVHDLTLVTHNTQDFVKVPGLRLEDWLST